MKTLNSFTSLLATLGCLCITSIMFTNCCRDGVRTEIRTFDKADWIGMLNGTFGDLTLRLNNYTPTDHEFRAEDEFAFFRPNDSFLTIESLGVSQQFDIPVQRSDPYSLYINDVNSTSLVPDARSGKAVITINFEDNGTEIIGNCVNNFFCFCGDPHVNLNDLKIDILLTLGADGGRLVITDVSADLLSTFQESGPCVDNACAFACDIFAPNRESQARNAIEGRVVSFFNNNRILIEQLLNTHIRSLGVTETITNVTIGGSGQLLLTVQYEDSCE